MSCNPPSAAPDDEAEKAFEEWDKAWDSEEPLRHYDGRDAFLAGFQRGVEQAKSNHVGKAWPEENKTLRAEVVRLRSLLWEWTQKEQDFRRAVAEQQRDRARAALELAACRHHQEEWGARPERFEDCENEICSEYRAALEKAGEGEG